MSSTVVEELINEAKAALQTADPLCLDANQIATGFKQSLEDSTVLYAKIQFLHDSLQDQLQNMGNLYVILSHGVDIAAKDNQAQLDRLNKAVRDLDGALSMLESVSLDPMHNPTQSPATLQTFLHQEDIQGLKEQTERMSEELKAASNEMIRLPDRLQKEISTLRDRQPTFDPDYRAVKPKLAELSERAESAAHDMAATLDSLTKHFDLACETETLRSQDEFDEAVTVLQNDRLHLNDALETISDVHNTLINTKGESDGYMEFLRRLYDAFVAFFNQADYLTTHSVQEYVQKMLEKQQRSKRRFSQVDTLVSELSGLSQYYHQFHRSYHALLLEMARRKRSQAQLQKTIKEMNTLLSAAYDSEVSSRTEFIQTHGEFLPQEIWADLDTMPRLNTIEPPEDP